MRLRHAITGDVALQRAFAALGESLGHDVAIEALIEAAEPIRETASDLAPHGRGPGPHLADHIIAAETSRVPWKKGRWRDTEATEHVVAIGPSYQPSDLFYGLFQELGTVNHPAQPFLRPAFDMRWRESLRLLGRSMWDVIRRVGR